MSEKIEKAPYEWCLFVLVEVVSSLMVSDMLVFAPDVSVAKNHQVLYPESDACFSPFRYALVSAYFYE